MGLIYAELELRNGADLSLAPVRERALVDTGAAQLCIPDRLRVQLQLRELYRRKVTTADGVEREVPYVGPIDVKFGNRGCMVGAFVLGNNVLMGAIPIEDMDLVLSPLDGTVKANPRSPNIPSAIVMDARETP